MKYFITVSATTVTFLALLVFQACSDTPKGDQATITDKEKAAQAIGQNFVVDTSTSRIRFIGNGVGKNHPGKFHLASGNVALSGNQITGGQFMIDVRSLDLEQKGAAMQGKLRPHLMSGDFFDAEKFGTAKFEITQVTPYQPNGKDTSIVRGANFNISGNLTLKDVTRNVTFPAKIDLDGNMLKAKSDFNINRTQWQMNYGNDKTWGDKFISETVNIELDLEARKQ
ncbi:MAG: YceI family protein [Saprospiraceae bacterium]|nr:YceI family protein [Saprospiraceae bacterium]